MATYTSIESIDVPFLSECYGLGDVTLEPVKGGSVNSSFKVDAAAGAFTLTVLDNHDHESAIALAWHTRALFEAGIPTSEVVASCNAELVVMMHGRPAVLKRWIDGDVLEWLPEAQLRAAGVHLAKLHDLPPDLIDVPVGARRLSEDHLALIGSFADREFADWFDRWLSAVAAKEPAESQPAVFCHGDLFTDNIIVCGDGAIALLDWETIALDDPLLDLGMSILGLAREGGRLSIERAAVFLSGYATIRPDVGRHLDQLPTEIIRAALIIAFHRYYQHNVRFPDPTKATSHRELIAFVDSVPRSLTISMAP